MQDQNAAASSSSSSSASLQLSTSDGGQNASEQSQQQRSKGSGRGLIVPTKTAVIREVTLPSVGDAAGAAPLTDGTSGHSIQIRHGDIGKEDTTAIASPTNDAANLTQGIAGTVLRGAGRRVKKECDELVQAKGKIPVTQCLVSSAGNLPCKHLIHVHAPAPPKEPTDNADQYIEQYQHSLRNLFVTALQKQCESLAIPALCSVSQFPKAAVAVVTLHEVLEFFAKNPQSPLKHIRLTSFDLEMTCAFKEEFERRKAQQFGVTPLPKTEKEMAALLPKKLTTPGTDTLDVTELLEALAK